MMPTVPLDLVCDVATWMLLAALALAFVRLVRGPTLADRVVALDLIAVVLVGWVAVEAIRTGRTILLRPALVLALVGFLGTLAFARYLERRARR
jgi:multicomponent Na+:H+ antiporter subunit F